jgi:hypothetical protein
MDGDNIVPQEIRVATQKMYVMMFKDDHGDIQTMLDSDGNGRFKEYGILIADLIRHVAQWFDVDASRVMYWVKKELINPTTGIAGGRQQ